ncbi:hypothetical protein Nepgr_003322 [Nepenthes gracilis]|uniref:Cullin family profile domain-containing protein n=1 Tax=Nepenthes gracilis TaxID=150966 RepID=A0AAD3XDE1_NEPGR|nr:hypothetical protein Nepgr_003322 [Nepenthes gracilis]
MLMICGIALCLDRAYVKQTPNVRLLLDMDLQLFRKHLSSCPEVEHEIVMGLLRLIERERLGEAFDRTFLNHLLKMFTAQGIYQEIFEKPLLACTEEFYAAKGVKYLQESDIPDYLKHVEMQLHEEHESCVLYLDVSTRKPLISTAEKQLLERHITAILDKVSCHFKMPSRLLLLVEGKDVFEAFYKTDLAKRILLGKSASTDAEKSMISKLKLLIKPADLRKGLRALLTDYLERDENNCDSSKWSSVEGKEEKSIGRKTHTNLMTGEKAETYYSNRKRMPKRKSPSYRPQEILSIPLQRNQWENFSCQFAACHFAASLLGNNGNSQSSRTYCPTGQTKSPHAF